jgi:hypothetical protein
MMNVIKTTKHWEFLAPDLVGPLPTSHSGHKHILVVRDHFSKWVEFFPLKKAICMVREVFTRFGPTEKLLADNGSQFVSKVLKAVCER